MTNTGGDFFSFFKKVVESVAAEFCTRLECVESGALFRFVAAVAVYQICPRLFDVFSDEGEEEKQVRSEMDEDEYSHSFDRKCTPLTPG